ncbi:MAG: response regulator [Deltaproteobacteria bacterium]|nr:response regulator [Deltaproteobacteria bacterium]
MDKIENRLSPIVRNIITSGMDEKHDIETMRKVMLLNSISITGVIFMVPLGIVAFVQGNSPLGFIDHFVSLILILNILYLRRSKNYQIACYVGIVITGILYLYLLATGGVNNTAHVWYYTFPLVSSFLLGSKRGAVATILLLMLAIIFFAVNFDLPYLTHYSKDFIIRFIPSFIVVFIFSYAFEYFREKAQEKLTAKNDELNKTIKELKETDIRLRKAREELEKRVQERTAELSKANIDLKHEIKVRERAEHERRRLETQLAHSHKMEAIGTLAGGVAHDLNNILSGTVSYPDLILMDLPEESPLRAPILTIQKSGKKAAAIVQDLLTLARRGLVATEVTNLNRVIANYIESPEFEKLKEFHPHAKIESNLEKNLLNILGSPVHLSKTVMNLVSNAAEAMDDGGNISITTESTYIDKPIRGYDTVKEGDYIILTVSDTGKGISAGDLERIFEPFFTKKKMGRSGTGLGMAVVWGTVKDHKGYIDIQSTEGKGTTFSLYFPVTREEISGKEKALLIEEYMGNGESILVVDDVEEQREIASRILNKLGYSVTSVSSGEEAIDYMNDNSADLLVLDMIMDPGIDGLETYKRIINLHPNQKAIIASGFSATDRVKEVQKIGAGAYVKKPYTLEKIGIVVKNELERGFGVSLNIQHKIDNEGYYPCS